VLTATGERLNPVRLRISHDEFVELQSSDAVQLAAAVERAGPVPGQ